MSSTPPTSDITSIRETIERAVDGQGLAEGWQTDEETGQERLPFYGRNDVDACGTASPLGELVALQLVLSPERAAEVIQYVVSGKGFVRLITEAEMAGNDAVPIEEI